MLLDPAGHLLLAEPRDLYPAQRAMPAGPGGRGDQIAQAHCRPAQDGGQVQRLPTAGIAQDRGGRGPLPRLQHDPGQLALEGAETGHELRQGLRGGHRGVRGAVAGHGAQRGRGEPGQALGGRASPALDGGRAQQHELGQALAGIGLAVQHAQQGALGKGLGVRVGGEGIRLRGLVEARRAALDRRGGQVDHAGDARALGRGEDQQRQEGVGAHQGVLIGAIGAGESRGVDDHICTGERVGQVVDDGFQVPGATHQVVDGARAAGEPRSGDGLDGVAFGTQPGGDRRSCEAGRTHDPPVPRRHENSPVCRPADRGAAAHRCSSYRGRGSGKRMHEPSRGASGRLLEDHRTGEGTGANVPEPETGRAAPEPRAPVLGPESSIPVWS